MLHQNLRMVEMKDTGIRHFVLASVDKFQDARRHGMLIIFLFAVV